MTTTELLESCDRAEAQSSTLAGFAVKVKGYRFGKRAKIDKGLFGEVLAHQNGSTVVWLECADVRKFCAKVREELEAQG